MRSTPGPGNPEMARRLAEQVAVEEKMARYAFHTRQMVYALFGLTLVLEAIRWLV